MIAKHVEAKKDDIRALGRYIADSRDALAIGPKVSLAWTEGCVSDDFFAALREMEATQARNWRCVTGKTYHLVVSFQPADGDKLAPGDYRAIEREIAEVLGFAGHQRVCAIHSNTGHLHLHVAYNMVDPVTFRKERSFHRYALLRKLCNNLERKYGLEPIKALANEALGKVPPKAADKVAHTGQESFYDYVLRQGAKIRLALELSQTWGEFHQGLLRLGLHLKARGAGLVLADRHGKHGAAPSKVDRAMSKGNLEKRFGPFEAASPDLLEATASEERYEAAPARYPERLSEALFAEFKARKKERLGQLAEIRAKENEDYHQSTEKHQALRHQYRHYPHYLERLRIMEREERARAKVAFGEQRQAIREAYPFTSWDTFLAFKAQQGDALSQKLLKLRQRKGQKTATTKTDAEYRESDLQRQALDRITLESLREQEKVSRLGLAQGHASALKAIIKMDEVLKIEEVRGNEPPKLVSHALLPEGLGYRVVFTFSNGGKISVSALELSVEGQDEWTMRVAREFALKKWGRKTEATGNTIKFNPALRLGGATKKEPGLGR